MRLAHGGDDLLKRRDHALRDLPHGRIGRPFEETALPGQTVSGTVETPRGFHKEMRRSHSTRRSHAVRIKASRPSLSTIGGHDRLQVRYCILHVGELAFENLELLLDLVCGHQRDYRARSSHIGHRLLLPV